MHFKTRREFLYDWTALAAALAGSGIVGEPLAATETTKTKTGDANDRLHVAVIGVRGRGRDHVQSLAGSHHCVVTTICDADEAVIGPAMLTAEKQQAKAPKYEQDLRRVLDDKSIDIITTATPNHWHALIAIWAMQANKDVYVEKPVSHNISEGRRIVETARKYNRICQSGTQIRSSQSVKQAMAFLHEEQLGKVRMARGLCYRSRGSIGKVSGPQPIPKSVNYDLWSGPAPLKPLMREKLHYDWHWIWEYGNGDLGNVGVHQMDVARWGLGVHELPRVAVSMGGRFGYTDDGQTANTQICVYDYGDMKLIFEVRGLKTGPFHKVSEGCVFYCENGLLVVPDDDIAIALTHDGKEIRRFVGGGDHFGNFVKAVRSRKASDLNADILEGHLSSALCHLGNISYRLGAVHRFNQKTKPFGDDTEACEALARMEEHLRENKVPLENSLYHLGRKLAFDPKTETFIGDHEADTYLTRDYRKPFVVPAHV